jgi:prolyl-tRNA synthetase
MMGGATAHEFMAPSPAGEDTVALCEKCGYAANTELAKSTPPPQPMTSNENLIPSAPPLGKGGMGGFSEQEGWKLEDISTPEKRTVAEVSEFLGLDPSFFIKSLLMIGEKSPFLALVRGDHELHEKKLQRIAGEFRVAQKEEVKDILGVEAGFVGPAGSKIKMIADTSLKEGIYVSGANKEGFHTKGIKPGVHFQAEWHDIHMAKEGDKCIKCGAKIRIERAIEVGNIFKLGTKYSKPLRAVYLDEKGRETPIIMGSYGIGPARIAAAAIEQNNDRDGIIWPQSITPFDVEVVPLNIEDAEVLRVAELFYKNLGQDGIEVLMDDRNVRPGIKFKDADLIGIPWQTVIGERNLKDGFVELKSRKTQKSERLEITEAMKKIKEAYSR